MANGPQITTSVKVDVETKQAQRAIKSFEKQMASIAGERTVFINAKIEGVEEVQKRLQNAIIGIKNVKFEKKGVMSEILGIQDAEKALTQFNAKLSSLTGRSRTALKSNIERVTEYIAAHNESIGKYTDYIMSKKAVNSFRRQGEYHNEGRKVALEQIAENLAIARQNGDYREQLKLLKQKQLLLEKIDKTNRATAPSAELVKTRQEIDALQKKEQSIGKANRALKSQSDLLSGLGHLAARYLSVFTIAHVVENMAKTAGYFQQQEVALEGILGSATKAKHVLDEIKSLALESPFQTKELVRYTKQLSAFGVDSDKLVGTMKNLADISAGLGVDMGRIILAYGQVKSAAVLRGQELRQFTEAGIPIIEALSKKLSEVNGRLVTTGEVFKFISERKVPFEMVASVLDDMTKEGGKFYKMQENLTDTLYGQIEKLKDVWTLTLNDVGGTYNKLFRSVIEGIANVIKHSKALMTAITAALTIRSLKSFTSLKGIFNGLSTEVHKIETSFSKSTAVMVRATGILNPFTANVSRLARAASSLWKIVSSGFGMVAVGAVVGIISEAIQKTKQLNNELKAINQSYSKETSKLINGFDTLVHKLHGAVSGTKEYNEALNTLQTNYGDYLNNDMLEALAKQKEGWEEIAESVRNAVREVQNYKNALDRADKAGEKANEDFSNDNWFAKLFSTTNAEGTTRQISQRLWQSFGNSQARADLLNREFGLEGEQRVVASEVDEFLKNFDKVNEVIKMASQNFFSNNGQTSADLKREIESLYGNDGIRKILSLYSDKYFSNLARSDGFEQYLSNLEQAENSPLNIVKKGFDDAITKAGKELEGTWKNISGLGTDTNEYRTANQFSAQYNPLVWDKTKQEHLIDAAISSVAQIFGEESANVIRDELAGVTDTSGRPLAVVNALDKLKETLGDRDLLYVLTSITTQFSNLARVETSRTVQVNDMIGNILASSGSSAEKKDFYNRYLASDSNYQAMEDKVRSDRAKTAQYLQEHKRGTGAQAKVYEQYERELAWLNDLFDNIYKLKEKDKSGGGRYARIRITNAFDDILQMIKKAEDASKKVAGVTGFTEAMNDFFGGISTYIGEFFKKGGKPFEKMFEEFEKNGVTEFLPKGFDAKSLETMFRDAGWEEGREFSMPDFRAIYSKVVNGVATETLANLRERQKGYGKDSSEYQSLEQRIKQLDEWIIRAKKEEEIRWGYDAVKVKLDEAIKSLTDIRSDVADIRAKREVFDRLADKSNFLAANKTIYGTYNYHTADEVERQRQLLLGLLGSSGGSGIAATKNGALLKNVLDSETVNARSISMLYEILKGLKKQAGSQYVLDNEGNIKKDANGNPILLSEQFKEVLPQFTAEVDKMIRVLITEYEELADLRDDTMKSADKFTNAARKYIDSLNKIDKALQKGTIDNEDEKATDMRINAAQKLFEDFAKKIPEEFKYLFKDKNSPIGISNNGFRLMQMTDGNLVDKYERARARKLAEQQDKITKDYQSKQKELEANKEKYSEEEFSEEMKKLGDEYGRNMQAASNSAAADISQFSSTIAVIDKIIKWVYGAIKALVDVGKSMIKLMRANNGITSVSYDKYGNKIYDKAFDEARMEKTEKALDAVQEFNQHAMDGWESLKSGNFLGAISHIVTSIFDLTSSISDILDVDIQAEIKKLAESNKNLQKTIEKFNWEMNYLAGTSRMDKVGNIVAALKEQYDNYMLQYEKEFSSKTPDTDALEEYEKGAVESYRQAVDMIQNLRTEIAGTADDIASRLSDAFVSAFKEGKNAAREWRDAVSEYISDVLKNILITKVLGPQVQSVIDQWMGGSSAQIEARVDKETGKINYNGKQMTVSEYYMEHFMDENAGKTAQGQLNALGTAMTDYFNNMPEWIRSMIGWNSSKSALSGGIEGITEDTARQLEGLANSILAQHVISNQYLQKLTTLPIANVQMSWFSGMLDAQRRAAASAQSIEQAIYELRSSSAQPLHVTMG